MVHPKKKQRLLTFLANEGSSRSGSSLDPSSGSLEPTTRTDTFIISPSGPALVAVSSQSNTALIINSTIRHARSLVLIMMFRIRNRI
jgi:hypothetical protein